MTALVDNLKNSANKVRAKVEELELQMHLGKKESIDEFENQKKNMKDYLHGAEDNLKNAKDISADKMSSLKTKLEELKVQLALGKAETAEKFDEQKSKLQHKLNDIESDIVDLKGKADDKTVEWASGLSETFDDFKTKMDVFRLNVALGSADAKDEWKEKKEDMKQKLQALKSKLNDTTIEGGEKLNDFNAEIAESFSHFKSAFKKIF
ncbi:MAG: hypothetical protein KJO64_00045 [Bacteroidia bacterium]|nr:hypothetical protein [Bacteroidia bacterium]NNC86629.1 hypothetical protein [Bacteroidia bacterium]